MANKVSIYTDGSCDNLRHPNYGGWAYVIIEDGVAIEEDAGCGTHTTNNRMELNAILFSLLNLPFFTSVTIYTDSQYCIGVLTKKYRAQANLDLIEQFFEIVEEKSLDVSFEWVKGHSGNKWNEKVDKMANDAFFKISGYDITDYKRLQQDKEYKKQVYKESKDDIRNKEIADILKKFAEETKVTNKLLDWGIHQINKLFKS